MPSLSVQGKWKGSSTWNTILDPLNGEPFIKVAEVDETGVQVCVMSSLQVPSCFIFKTIFPVFYCTENDLAELRSLCFIMPSFPCHSLTNSIILTLKWLLMSAYLHLNQFFLPNCELIMQPFVDSLSKCPKHGVHNPFKAPERFVLLVPSLCFFLLLLFFCLCFFFFLPYQFEIFSLRIPWLFNTCFLKEDLNYND